MNTNALLVASLAPVLAAAPVSADPGTLESRISSVALFKNGIVTRSSAPYRPPAAHSLFHGPPDSIRRP